MQAKYAEKPVRFLLFPSNQFKQEPRSNSDVKAFAQQSVTLAKAGEGSNVIMFAKSNLNNVTCTYDGADACTPSSADCCPKNDVVYKYLLAETPPGRIQWNFDKVVLGMDGKPFIGETILRGTALDEELSVVIDKLLADGEDAGFEESLLVQQSARFPGFAVLVAAVSTAGLLVLIAIRKSAGANAGTSGSEQEPPAAYILVG